MNQNSRTSTSKIKKHAIAIVALAIMVVGACYFTRLAAGYRGDVAAWVHIPKNATVDEAKDSINKALGSQFGSTVAMLWNQNVEESHGAYKVVPGERAWQVARRISAGRQTPIKVTFNNQRTFGQFAGTIADKLDFTAEEFEAVAEQIIRHDSITRHQFEAQFLPDTYELYWSATPEAVIRKIRANYHRFWNEDRLKAASRMGLTPLQVSVLASIVEEESNRVDERGKIARLYLNRLHRGMLLQADPTVKFASGKFDAKRIAGEMLKADSPYNTYRYVGLPPGIIRMPEARTIDQVLSAPQHDYVYMCARPDRSGYHDFTSSYTQHLANARAFRKAVY